jgi:hypothetical protein
MIEKKVSQIPKKLLSLITFKNFVKLKLIKNCKIIDNKEKIM